MNQIRHSPSNKEPPYLTLSGAAITPKTSYERPGYHICAGTLTGLVLNGLNGSAIVLPTRTRQPYLSTHSSFTGALIRRDRVSIWLWQVHENACLRFRTTWHVFRCGYRDFYVTQPCKESLSVFTGCVVQLDETGFVIMAMFVYYARLWTWRLPHI